MNKNNLIFILLIPVAAGAIFSAWFFLNDNKKFELPPNPETSMNTAVNNLPVSSEKSKTNNSPTQNQPANNQVKPEIPMASADAVIRVLGTQTTEGVKLAWTLDKSTAPNGFKIVRSENENPEYPKGEAQDLADGSARSYEWKTADGEGGKKYNFRVCLFDGKDSCLAYSNNTAVAFPLGEEDFASKISLTAEKKDASSVKLKWKISGGEAPEGFKLMMSESKDPEYPKDVYRTISDSDKKEYTWESNFGIGKTYHFRVCVFKGSDCGEYSDDEKVSF